MSSSLHKNVLTRGNKRLGNNAAASTPLKWDEYFDEERDVTLEQGVFHVYKKGNSGPTVVALHGGGYSGLTWALFAKDIVSLVECQIIAIDLRGHGKTQANDEADLSLETMAGDVIDVLNKIQEDGKEQQNFVIIGHSMGGAIAVEVAVKFHVTAMVVIDVVEGTALESLSSMQSILRGRPTSFESIEEAIRWCYRSGMTHNIEAARVSVPGQIKNSETGELAASEFERGAFVPESDQPAVKQPARSSAGSVVAASNAIPEEDEEQEIVSASSQANLPPSGKFAAMPPPSPPTSSSSSLSPTSKLPNNKQNKGAYKWRIDLSKTEEFWNGWFKGLSAKFLSISSPKVLLMANIHNLDTALTLGQMQGKFQMQVLGKSGHAIHEDQPQHVAEVIGSFLVKQRFTTAREGFSPLMPAC